MQKASSNSLKDKCTEMLLLFLPQKGNLVAADTSMSKQYISLS